MTNRYAIRVHLEGWPPYFKSFHRSRDAAERRARIARGILAKAATRHAVLARVPTRSATVTILDLFEGEKA